MKTKLMALLAAIAAAFGAWGAPTVTDITAKQRYPWNGLVDITCKVSGIEAETGRYEFVAVAVDKDTGKEYEISNYSIKHGDEDTTGLDVYENGDYELLWNAREDLGQIVVERMTVRITLEALAVSVGKVQLWEGGPYWADRNIGASAPWKYGRYFWWGDTVGSLSNFSLNSPTHSKSVATLKNEGWITSNDILVPGHDAAHVMWGGGWRMPTIQEFEDLNNKCDWTWTTLNDVNGYIVRGRGNYASKSIFLPAAGYRWETSLYLGGSHGTYWSSVPFSDSDYAYELNFSSDFHVAYYYVRYVGRSIRPVQ